MGILVKDIVDFCSNLLQCQDFNDCSFNGLQVEGSLNVRKIVTGVTANIELFKRATLANADMVLTHHGLYWKGADPRLVDVLGKRVKALGQMSLAAFHLPLDAHPIIGNNALIISSIGAEVGCYIRNGAKQDIAIEGFFTKPVSVLNLSFLLEKYLGRRPLIMGPQEREVQKFLVCSGGGGFLLEEDLGGIDVLITGEVHEQHYHLAQERNITTFVCGHHATECCGISALGQCVAEKFGIEHEFINVVSPL
jgi:dinuclear metal center YbgI/SA1388 family protein